MLRECLQKEPCQSTMEGMAGGKEAGCHSHWLSGNCTVPANDSPMSIWINSPVGQLSPIAVFIKRCGSGVCPFILRLRRRHPSLSISSWAPILRSPRRQPDHLKTPAPNSYTLFILSSEGIKITTKTQKRSCRKNSFQVSIVWISDVSRSHNNLCRSFMDHQS